MSVVRVRGRLRCSGRALCGGSLRVAGVVEGARQRFPRPLHPPAEPCEEAGSEVSAGQIARSACCVRAREAAELSTTTAGVPVERFAAAPTPSAGGRRTSLEGHRQGGRRGQQALPSECTFRRFPAAVTRRFSQQSVVAGSVACAREVVFPIFRRLCGSMPSRRATG